MSCYRVLKSEGLIQSSALGTTYVKQPNSGVSGTRHTRSSTKYCKEILPTT